MMYSVESINIAKQKKYSLVYAYMYKMLVRVLETDLNSWVK